MNQLAKIEVARQALAEAKEIKDVKVILDKAEAVKHFLKQQNYTIEIQNYANVFCIEAQIKLGEMLKEMPKNEGTKGRGRPSLGGSKTEPPKEQPPTYAELNINKKDASRCQQIAENKKEIIEKIKEVQAKPTDKPIIANRLINEVLQEKQKKERKENTLLPLPKNKYGTIVIDPPWPIEKILRDVTPTQGKFDYPTMEIAKIKEIELPSTDNCQFLCGSPRSFYQKGLKYLKRGGFGMY